MNLLRKIPKALFGQTRNCHCSRSSQFGWVGNQLPVNIYHIPTLLIVFTVWYASGISLPFIIYRYLLYKKNN